MELTYIRPNDKDFKSIGVVILILDSPMEVHV